ncbi:Calcium binding EGF domain containing protein [Aphelenchoides avenae]|nr:Calcium binding EGF domain containing protein [Aphelenchus avenae]
MWILAAVLLFFVTRAVAAASFEADKDSPAPVIYTTSREIFYHSNGDTRSLLSGLRTPVVVDYSYNEGMLIWIESMDRTGVHVCRVPRGEDFLEAIPSCNGTNADVNVVKDQVNNTWGLAVDWVHSLLFRTDLAHHKVFVTDLRTMRERVLMDSHVDNPEAVAVDPAMGLIFWRNAGHIERAGMDGLDRAVGLCKPI